MKVEVSRRRFLQGSVALSIAGATAINANSVLSDKNEKTTLPGIEPTKTGIGIAENIPFLCGICVNKCAGFARVEDGIVTKLNPNPYFPKSRNMLCARGNAGLQTLYDPDRLKYPLVRTGERGDGQYKRVSWEEAYEAILNGTEKFKGIAQILDEEKDNRSTMGYCNGEGLSKEGFEELISAKMGTPNYVDEISICLETTLGGYFGTIGTYGEADMNNADYIIVAGANRAEAIITPDTMDMFKRTRGRGLTTIVIDPRFTNTASKADRWYGINPGTDLAFVLALTYVVLSENLYDAAFVAKYGVGFEDYKEHVLSHGYTPKWASKITNISESEIYKTAREFMASEHPIYYQGRRSVFARNDFQLRRAMAIFQGLSGNLDKKGGIIYGKKLSLPKEDISSPMYAQAQSRFDTKVVAIPANKTGSWILFRNMVLEGKNPYPIRAMFMRKHNPMSCVPNTTKTEKFLKSMDLNVMIDILPSDTTMFADVILPEASYLERTSPVASFGGLEPAIVQRKAVIKPLYDCKTPEVIYKELAEKLAKPLFEISKKYDEYLQYEIKDRGEEAVFKEDGYDFADAWEKSVHELNEEKVVKAFGEEAWITLEEKGVYYPHMEDYHKKLNVNEYQYYPENKKNYTTKKDELKVVFNFKNLESKGIDPMPTWHDDYEFKVPVGKFRLVTGRHAQFTQSGTTNNAMLRDLIPTNYVWINKRVAQSRGIEFSDDVEVSSSVGKIVLKAYPTEKIGENVIFLAHGFGGTSDSMSLGANNGGNDARIIEDSTEPVYGAAAMHETNVEIRKV
jgi:thiosulfate reductase/polysulfide reductase chain A